MTTVPFDTLKLATTLENSGFTSQQARGAAAALGDAFAEEMVTRTYLDTRLEGLKAYFDGRLDSRLEALKSELLKYIIAQTFVLIGIVMAMLHFGH